MLASDSASAPVAILHETHMGNLLAKFCGGNFHRRAAPLLADLSGAPAMAGVGEKRARAALAARLKKDQAIRVLQPRPDCGLR